MKASYCIHVLLKHVRQTVLGTGMGMSVTTPNISKTSKEPFPFDSIREYVDNQSIRFDSWIFWYLADSIRFVMFPFRTVYQVHRTDSIRTFPMCFLSLPEIFEATSRGSQVFMRMNNNKAVLGKKWCMNVTTQVLEEATSIPPTSGGRREPRRPAVQHRGAADQGASMLTGILFES